MVEYGQNIEENCLVEISPHYDLWMMGDRFGKILSVDLTNHTAKVKMQITKRNCTFPLQDLIVR